MRLVEKYGFEEVTGRKTMSAKEITVFTALENFEDLLSEYKKAPDKDAWASIYPQRMELINKIKIKSYYA